MGAPAKFLFDQDFAAGGGKPTVSLAEHAKKLAEAEAAGYRAGFAAAQQEISLAAERQMAQAFERIANALNAVHAGLAAVEARLETEAVEVAVAVARKLAPTLIEREPLAEIAALAKDCFAHLVAAPHVVVRVNEAQHAVASEKLTEIARARGFEGRLVVLAEPDIAFGDCRIDWADGGVIRDSAAIASAIEFAVARYIGGRTGDAPIPPISWRAER